MLGIGAATAVFRDVNSLMSIRVSEPGPRGGRTGYTVDHFIDLREHSSIFEGLTASTISDVFWTGRPVPEHSSTERQGENSDRCHATTVHVPRGRCLFAIARYLETMLRGGSPYDPLCYRS